MAKQEPKHVATLITNEANTSQNVVFTGTNQTNSSTHDAAGIIQKETEHSHLQPGTAYTIAWKAVYCRDRITGDKIRYIAKNPPDGYYLDETEIKTQKLTTAAEEGTCYRGHTHTHTHKHTFMYFFFLWFVCDVLLCYLL